MKASGKSFEEGSLERQTLHHWKLVKAFRTLFDQCHQGRALSATERDPRRTLQACDYGAWMLLALFNPLIHSARALCRLSENPKVRQSLQCSSRLSLGSFSAAQHLFDPHLWRRVLRELAAPNRLREGEGPRLSPAAWLAVDSTLWKVVPRMGWAVWRHQYIKQQALRLQVKVHVGSGLPVEGDITPSNVCERRTLRGQLQAGECYLGDACYGEDYNLLRQMDARGCGFLVRLRHTAAYEVMQERALSALDRAAGVVRDAQVQMGTRQRSGPWRLVQVQAKSQPEPLLLLGNDMTQDLDAAQVAALYRQRWQVELFFRWLKCVLPCRHWLAESRQGVSLQVYSALICALLLARNLGRLPRLAEMELLMCYQMGWITLKDLSLRLEYWREEYLAQAARRAAKKHRQAP